LQRLLLCSHCNFWSSAVVIWQHQIGALVAAPAALLLLALPVWLVEQQSQAALVQDAMPQLGVQESIQQQQVAAAMQAC
jgi:hypothetical protein